MENFNKKFKNRSMMKVCWRLAKATTMKEFTTFQSELHPDAYQWLADIGFHHITLLFSPVCRYGMLTSNNVESFNNRVVKLRSLPVLDLLFGIEKISACDFHASYESASRWTNDYTKLIEDLFCSKIAAFPSFLVFPTAPTQFIVKNKNGGSFQVCTSGQGSCSCNGPIMTEFPCSHLLLVLQKFGFVVPNYVGDIWKKELYKAAYLPFSPSFPVTIVEELSQLTLLPPVATRRRGRPKRKRIESQQSTLQLEKNIRKYRCSKCKCEGHRANKCST